MGDAGVDEGSVRAFEGWIVQLVVGVVVEWFVGDGCCGRFLWCDRACELAGSFVHFVVDGVGSDVVSVEEMERFGPGESRRR